MRCQAQSLLQSSYSSLTVVIATAASTVLCFIVVMTTTVCVNCLRSKYCNANTRKWTFCVCIKHCTMSLVSALAHVAHGIKI